MDSPRLLFEEDFMWDIMDTAASVLVQPASAVTSYQLSPPTSYLLSLESFP